MGFKGLRFKVCFPSHFARTQPALQGGSVGQFEAFGGLRLFGD